MDFGSWGILYWRTSVSLQNEKNIVYSYQIRVIEFKNVGQNQFSFMVYLKLFIYQQFFACYTIVHALWTGFYELVYLLGNP